MSTVPAILTPQSGGKLQFLSLHSFQADYLEKNGDPAAQTRPTPDPIQLSGWNCSNPMIDAA
jgi:hypothetical protein